MSIFVIHNSHELHQLKKVLPLLRGSTVSYTHLDVYKRQQLGCHQKTGKPQFSQ